MSSRPCSIVRKPSMWSNDRFSIIRTTTWSILRRFWSASVTSAPPFGRPSAATLPGGRPVRQTRSGDGQLQIHPGLLVPGDRAVDIVGAGLQVDVERRLLAGRDVRRLLVDAVALDHEVVLDVAVVLDRDGVRARRDGRLRERDLEF